MTENEEYPRAAVATHHLVRFDVSDGCGQNLVAESAHGLCELLFDVLGNLVLRCVAKNK